MEGVIWQNVVKMYEYRGGRCDTVQDVSGVSARIKNQNYILAQGTARGEPLTCCILADIDIKKDHISAVLKAVAKIQTSGECLLIFSRPPSPYVRNLLDDAKKYPFRVIDCLREIFCFELPRHNLVPRHWIASADEIALLEASYCAKSALPAILERDPAAIWIGARKGDVVMVSRLSETAGEAIAARICK